MFKVLLWLAIAIRLAVVLVAWTQVVPSWSGGGDSGAYIALAESLLSGAGYTYAGQPTAFRPPGYPLLLAGAMWVFGEFWPVAIRLLQFALGIHTAFIVGEVAARFWDSEVRRPAIILALWHPGLIYITTLIGTESFGAWAIAFFLGLALRGRIVSGALLGIATLFRQAAPVLCLPLLLTLKPWKKWVLAAGLAALIVLPWAVRNWYSLGSFTHSTYTNITLLAGILDPTGRTQPSKAPLMKHTLGWSIADYETNNPQMQFPGELDMTRSAMEKYREILVADPYLPVRVLPEKLGAFWLSLDMLGYSPLRALAVLYWYSLFGLVLAGFFIPSLRHRYFALVWLVTITLAHVPFCMNTRLRIPFADVVVIALAAGVAARFRWGRWLGSETLVPKRPS